MDTWPEGISRGPVWSGPECSDWHHGDAIGTHVAVSRSHDHAERAWLSALGGVHALGEPQEARGGCVGLTGTELDLEGRPAAIGRLDDGIDFQARVVSVLENLRVGSLGIDAQVPDDQ